VREGGIAALRGKIGGGGVDEDAGGQHGGIAGEGQHDGMGSWGSSERRA